MTAASPADPRVDLLQSISAALQTTPIMSRLHDPDHVLSAITAHQLVESLERLGIVVTWATAGPLKSATRA